MIRTYSLGVLGLTIQYPFVDGMTGMGLVKWGLTFSMLRKGIFLVSVFAPAADFRGNGRYVSRAAVRCRVGGVLRLRGHVPLAEAGGETMLQVERRVEGEEHEKFNLLHVVGISPSKI